MRREEFPLGRPDWEKIIVEEGLTYSVDGPDDPDHYWNEYAAYVFSPEEMNSVRAQAEEMHRMCLSAVDYLASGAFGTLGLPHGAFNLAVESWNRRDPDFYGRFDFIYSGVPGEPLKLLEYNADTPTGIVEAAVCQKTWAKDQRLDMQGYAHWGEIGEAFVDRWRQIFAPELTSGQRPVLHLAHVPEDIDENQEDYNNLWLIAYAAQQAGIETILIPIDEIIFDEPTKSWKDAEGRPISNLFKLYPWEDLATRATTSCFSPTTARCSAGLSPPGRCSCPISCCWPLSGISTRATRTWYPPTPGIAATCATGFASPSSGARATAWRFTPPTTTSSSNRRRTTSSPPPPRASSSTRSTSRHPATRASSSR